jgi:hypothetical protein
MQHISLSTRVSLSMRQRVTVTELLLLLLLYGGGSRYDFVDYRRHECGEQALRQAPARAALGRVRERRLQGESDGR